MLPEGILLSSDGLLDITEERLNGLLVQDDINEIYDVEQTPFARGKFAAVRRAIHKKSGVHFAAKFLKRRRRAQSSDKEIKHEIAVLILCSESENIVQLNAVHESRSDTALLLELATGGELQAFLDNEGSLTEAQARICMREVLKALQFLHKRSIAHLDLKPQNILLTGENVEDGLKLCDFGISRVIENGSKVREILGTPDYVAPEVLQYEPLCLQTDIWSVGVLTYVLLSGYSPFGGDTKQETFLNISQCTLSFPDELFKGVSDQAIDFMKSTLRIKPNDRLTAMECLEHFWLKDEFTIDKRFCNVSVASDGISSDPYEIIDDEDDDDDDDEDREIEENDYSDDQLSNIILNKKQSTNNKLNGCMPKQNNSNYNNSIEISTQNHQHTIPINNGRINSSLTTRKTCSNSNNTNSSNNSTINIQNNQKQKISPTTATSTNYDDKTKIIDEDNSENKENYLMNSSQLVLHLNGNNNSKIINSGATNSSTVSNGTNIRNNVTRDNNCSLQLNGLNNTSYQTENVYDLYHNHNQHHHQIEKLKSPQLVSSNSSSSTMTFSPNTSSNTSTNGTTTATTNGHLNQNGTSLFPDAPTTPKVIRKAPSDSPTSVKALVKKFQLESGEPLQAPALLKESILGTEYNECLLTNGSSTSTTTTTVTTTTTNELKYLNGCNVGGNINSNGSNSNDILNNEQHCNSNTKLLNGSTSNSINNSPAKSFKQTVASVAAAASCSVFCLHKCNGCGNTSSPGCRHSGNTTSQVVNNCSSNTNTTKTSSSICLDHSIIC